MTLAFKLIQDTIKVTKTHRPPKYGLNDTKTEKEMPTSGEGLPSSVGVQNVSQVCHFLTCASGLQVWKLHLLLHRIQASSGIETSIINATFVYIVM